MGDTERKFYRTIVISDIHLGYKSSKVRQLCSFLSRVDCDRLILNGDIFDGWQLRRKGSKWRPEYTQLVKIVMRMMENPRTEVIYTVGNHDAFIDKVIPISLANISVVKEYVLESGDHRYFVTHGDVFDEISTNITWLAKIGDLGYRVLVVVNKLYDKWRHWRGKPKFSFSIRIRRRVKEALASKRLYEMMADIARTHKCDGIICGHTHRPEDRMIGDIRYLNSGDWVETMTALLEESDGNWELLKFDESDRTMKEIEITPSGESFKNCIPDRR